MASPAGTVAIDNQYMRGMLAMFFAKTRMGWRETAVNRHKEPVGDPIDIEDLNAARQRNIDLVTKVFQGLKTDVTSGG